MGMETKLKWDGRAVVGAVRDAAATGLRQWAEHVLTTSNDRAPLEEGTLERSGVAQVDERKLEAVVAYDTPYAVDQHENLEYRHAAGRQAKFLETAVNDTAQDGLALVAKQIRKATA